MIDSFRQAWQNGDWRAAQALFHEAFGLPVQRVEDDRQVTIVVQSVLDTSEFEGEELATPAPSRRPAPIEPGWLAAYPAVVVSIVGRGDSSAPVAAVLCASAVRPRSLSETRLPPPHNEHRPHRARVGRACWAALPQNPL